MQTMTIIVPCYNEEAALPIFYKEVKKVLMGLTSTYELIVVNDGSKDNTLNKLTGLSEMDVHVKYYSFSRKLLCYNQLYTDYIKENTLMNILIEKFKQRNEISTIFLYILYFLLGMYYPLFS